MIRESHVVSVHSEISTSRDNPRRFLSSSIESRKSTRSNEFRNRAEEKLPRKVIVRRREKGEMRFRSEAHIARLKGKTKPSK